ncbi:hypothetical protein KR018_004380, partial [Drosophila ironensis]
MAPRVRISKVLKRKAEPDTDTDSVPEGCNPSKRTQTDPVPLRSLNHRKKSLATPVPSHKSRRHVNQDGSSPVNDPTWTTSGSTLGKNDKICQTEWQGKTAQQGKVMAPRDGFDGKMGQLKDLLVERRGNAHLWDRERLATLMRNINADPPPSWKVASQMWQEVEQLEERIKAYESNK